MAISLTIILVVLCLVSCLCGRLRCWWWLGSGSVHVVVESCVVGVECLMWQLVFSGFYCLGGILGALCCKFMCWQLPWKAFM